LKHLGADEDGSATRRTLVLGMGCILMRDDGVGPSALATFASLYELPDDVELLDIGTPGPELAHHIGGYDALIVFDALRIPSPPGTVRCLTRNEILAAPLLNPRLSPHDPGLREALLAAEFFGEAPRDVLLVGIVPKQVELGTELSPEVAAALPRAAEAAASELLRLGILPVPRHEPALEEVWWRSA
jgi:hydrogenase maturation protease